MPVYYNEHDAQKAAWLRELMRRNLIAPGEVDERSIEVIQPDELREFAQCHFFAGIGVWSYALRNAGWSDSSPVWTGSCPCPSFSQSGKGEGFDDPRHLWPAWFRLLRVCRPDVVFGEQVASDSALSWLDLVSSDLEGEGYAIGAADLCAAGVGAPHIRQRLYFVAHADGGWGFKDTRHTTHAEQHGVAGSVEYPASDRYAQRASKAGTSQREEPSRPTQQRHGASDVLGDTQSKRCGEAGAGSRRSAKRASDSSEPRKLGNTDSEQQVTLGEIPQRESGSAAAGMSSKLGDAESARLEGERGESRTSIRHERGGQPRLPGNAWADAEWLPCRDGKARPVEPGTFPLAHGAPARVVRLRGYGDAIVAPLAQAFIEAYQQVRAA